MGYSPGHCNDYALLIITAQAQYCQLLKNLNENEGHIRDKTIQNCTNFRGQDCSQLCSVPYKINSMYLLRPAFATRQVRLEWEEQTDRQTAAVP